MTMDPTLVPTSRFLSKVLRHAPESVGLTLDEAGWVGVEQLMEAAGRAGVALDRATLDRVVGENEKQRFALSCIVMLNQLDLAPVGPMDNFNEISGVEAISLLVVSDGSAKQFFLISGIVTTQPFIGWMS